MITSESLAKVPPVAVGGGVTFAIDRALRLEDGAILLEFPAEPGATYQVEYRGSGPWMASPGRIRAGGNRVQWIDNGSPKTPSHPMDAPGRLYRIRRVAAEGG